MRKVKASRVIILIVGFLLIVAAILFGTKFVLDMIVGGDDKPQGTQDPIVSLPTETYDSLNLELVDYEVYKIDDVDFNFVLVDLKISDKEAVKYSLTSLYTDEKTVKVSDYKKYIDQLDGLGYYVGAKNVDYDIKSDKTSDTFKIFIPVVDKDKKDLTIYDAITKAEIKIDLTKKVADPSGLKYTTGKDETISTEDYEIKVANAYIETSLVQNGQEYSYPSTMQVYAFVLDVISLNNDQLVLEDAVFIPSGSSEETHALDASVMSIKINNFMSRSIQKGDHGALFFEMFSPQDSNITYTGTLKLKFSNSDNWLSIETGAN